MVMTSKSSTGIVEQFKYRYGPYSSVLYYMGGQQPDPIRGIIKKDYDLLNSREGILPVKYTFGGSVGFHRLPTANYAKTLELKLTSYNQYARLHIERKYMKASRSRQASFVEGLKEEVDNKVNNFSRISDLAAYNDGTAILGQFSTNATGSAAAPVVTILTTGNYRFRPFYFEEGDIVEIEKDVTGTPALQVGTWEIASVNAAANQVTLTRLTGTVDLTTGFTTTNNIVLEKSSTLDTAGGSVAGTRRVPMGLLGIKNNPNGLYGYGGGSGVLPRRYRSTTTDRSNQAISPDAIVGSIIEFNRQKAKNVTHIITSPTQQRILMAQVEGRKDWVMNSTAQGVANRVSDMVMGFSTIKVETPVQKPVDIVTSRFLRDDMIIIANNEPHLQCFIEDPTWFTDDDSLLDRVVDDDSYEARYGAYTENYWHPFYLDFLENNSVALPG